MKLRRFLALFFLAAVLSASFIVPAYAVEDIHIEAKAALLADMESGSVLYSQEADRELAPASLTKIMTALLVLEAVERGQLNLEQMISASHAALIGLPYDSSNADPALVAGEEMSVGDLLYCVMVVSANEACNVLAEAVSGSVSAFVAAMNERAEALGCTNTHFANTNGLSAEGHYTTASDIWRITREALRHEMFAHIAETTWKKIPPTNKCEKERNLHTTNSLIDGWRYSGYQYSYAKGIKTGTTDEAGHCLVASATKGSRTLITVVLGAQTAPDGRGGTNILSFTETVRLMDWGFESFSTKTVLREEELICEVPVTLSKETNCVVVHPAYTATAVLPNDLEPETLERVVTLHNESVSAPVANGDELGSITLRYNGGDYVTVPLLALNDVEASRFLTVKHKLLGFFSQTWVKIVLLLLIIVIAAFVLFVRRYVRFRRYGAGRGRGYRRRSYRGRRF